MKDKFWKFFKKGHPSEQEKTVNSQEEPERSGGDIDEDVLPVSEKSLTEEIDEDREEIEIPVDLEERDSEGSFEDVPEVNRQEVAEGDASEQSMDNELDFCETEMHEEVKVNAEDSEHPEECAEEDLDEYVEEDLDEYAGEDLDEYAEEDTEEYSGDAEDDGDIQIEILDEDDFDEREETEAERALRQHRKRKKIRNVLLVLVGVLAAAYLGVSAYFYNHFYPNTVVNGIELSFGTAEQLDEYLENEVEDYTLTLKESDGGTESISGKDIDLKYIKGDETENLIKSQNPFLWITSLWNPPEIEAKVGVEYNEDKLDKIIEELECVKPEAQTPSVSAHPEFQDTEFVVVEEQLGTELDMEKFIEEVSKAVSEFLPELDLVEAGCYVLPKFTTEDPEVEAAKEQMNSYLGAEITLDFNPYTEVVDSSVISQWVTVDDNMAVTFNQDAVRSYVAGLAEKYDTYGKTRSFVTGFGTTVQIEGGSYGWQIDQEAEYNALIANIQNAEVVTREPNYARRGVSHEGNDFGNTYVEIDLTNQQMFYFQDGQCILQSGIVTGNPNKGNATPQGVYSIAYKQTNAVLRGPKQPDGTYEWESPVSYWMPFNGGIGLHDANWQSAFGGTRYLTYGSHGCVNLPPSVAATLYGYISAGTPVVCHY